MAALRFYWVVTAAGAVLMAMEIVSSRVLSPHFGSSVYVWGSIISVFLAALSVGYFSGGRLADAYPSLAALGRLVVLIAAGLALLLMLAEPVAAAVGRWTGGSPLGTLAATALLFGPATVMLGMVSPWAIRLAAHDLSLMGHTAGKLYALSTVGSLAGTLAATFLLIPYFQLGQIFGLLLLLTALTGLLALSGSLKSEVPAAALALGLAGLAVIHLPPVTHFEGALYRRITPYQTLSVVDDPEVGVRYLSSDGIFQSAVHLDDGSPALPYARVVPLALLFDPEIDSLLALGMGAGNVGTYLKGALPDLEVEYVEIDPAVPEVAQRFLGFTEGPGVTVHIDDGRRFLERHDRRWDLIVSDTYIGLSVPFHLTTLEFFELVRRRLEPGGVLAINLAGGISDSFPRAIYRTVSEEFPTVYAFAVAGRSNVMLFATDGPVTLSDEVLAARAAELDRKYHFQPTLSSIVERRLSIDLELASAPLLLDAFAPVERLIHVDAAAPSALAPAAEATRDRP